MESSSSRCVKVLTSDIPEFLLASPFYNSLSDNKDEEDSHTLLGNGIVAETSPSLRVTKAIQADNSKPTFCSSSMLLSERPEAPATDGSNEPTYFRKEGTIEEIEIPWINMKMDLVIEDLDDLNRLLSTLRFWGVDTALEEVMEFCLFYDWEALDLVLNNYRRELQYLEAIYTIRKLSDKSEWMAAAASIGCPCLLSCLHHKLKLSWDESTCQQIAIHGHLSCLKYAHECGCPWSHTTCNAAARWGHILCLRYALDNGCSCDWEEACVHAAEGGKLCCLQFLVEEKNRRNHKLVIERIALEQQLHEQLTLVEQEGGTPPQQLTQPHHGTGVASGEGNANGLDTSRAARFVPIKATHRAAAMGYIDCLIYLNDHGCPFSNQTCTAAAAGGHLACLIYAREHDQLWTVYTVAFTALAGQLHCLQYLLENGCPSNVYASAYAAQNGHLDCLRCCHEHGLTMDAATCAQAAAGGHLDCLKYAHEHGCPWDERTCRYAAYHNQLDCLKYAHEHGCPWDGRTCSYAVQRSSVECLQYLLRMRCPTNDNLTPRIAALLKSPARSRQEKKTGSGCTIM